MKQKKNYNFERDLERRINKAKRDVEAIILYQELDHNASEVARRMNIHRTTVQEIIAHHKTTNGKTHFRLNEKPKTDDKEKEKSTKKRQ